MQTITCIYIFMTALFSSLIMVPFLYRWGLEQKMLDMPDERKIHRHAVPRLGGIAICMSFLFSLLVFDDLSREIRGIIAGMLIVFITGIVDDLYGLSPRRKLFGEFCAVLSTITVSHLYVHTLGDLFGAGEIVLPFWLALPFTLVAVIGVINAFNLIDGLDGLAGGISVIALAVFGVLAYHSGNNEVLILSFALLGAVLGFLKYNFYPARIFMGDAGSLVIGFIISILAISLTQGHGNNIQPVVPLLVIGVPVADTLWVFGRRLYIRKNPFFPDRNHVHHKFLDLGFEHRYTVILIFVISLFWAFIAVIFYRQPEWVLLATYLLLSMLFYLLLRFLKSRRHLLRFLGKDSPDGIRASTTCRRYAETYQKLPLLQVFILIYLCLAVIFCNATGNTIRSLIVACLVVSSGLLFLTRDSSNRFLLSTYYGTAMVISYMTVTFSSQVLFYGLPLKLWGDIIILCILILTVLRFAFRSAGEFFLTSFDYLLLGLTIFLAVVAPQMTGVINLTGVLVRGIILFIALKVVADQGKRPAQYIAYILFGSLLLMSARIYLG